MIVLGNWWSITIHYKGFIKCKYQWHQNGTMQPWIAGKFCHGHQYTTRYWNFPFNPSRTVLTPRMWITGNSSVWNFLDPEREKSRISQANSATRKATFLHNARREQPGISYCERKRWNCTKVSYCVVHVQLNLPTSLLKKYAPECVEELLAVSTSCTAESGDNLTHIHRLVVYNEFEIHCKDVSDETECSGHGKVQRSTECDLRLVDQARPGTRTGLPERLTKHPHQLGCIFQLFFDPKVG